MIGCYRPCLYLEKVVKEVGFIYMAPQSHLVEPKEQDLAEHFHFSAFFLLQSNQKNEIMGEKNTTL